MASDRKIQKLLEDILVDAYGEDEQLWAFRQVIEDEVPLPAEGSVIGEAVQVTKIDYDGNPQRGLRATCRKSDGKTYEVTLEDVAFPEGSPAAPYVEAYRQWLGVQPPPKSRRAEFREKIKQTKVQVGELDLDKPVDLIVLAVRKQEMARCRLLGADREITLRSTGVWDVAPGEIVTVMPRKHWSFAGHPYLSGDVTKTRFDPTALNLTPLKLTEQGAWNPDNEYWGEEDEPLEDWAKEIIARGPRPEYELENIIPGRPEDFDIDTDPIIRAVELKDGGDPLEAYFALNDLLVADLRCLDAHAHLGNLAFDRSPETALRHYDIGRRIPGASRDGRGNGWRHKSRHRPRHKSRHRLSETSSVFVPSRRSPRLRLHWPLDIGNSVGTCVRHYRACANSGSWHTRSQTDPPVADRSTA